MARTRLSSKRRKTAATLFDADLLASIAPYLAAADLANLSLTCRTFGAVDQGGDGDDAPLPLVQESARRAILKEQTKAERAALVRYPGENWVDVYHQLLKLRAPLSFGILLGKGLEYEDGNKSRVVVCNSSRDTNTAISTDIMRGGKHYAEFSEVSGYSVRAGIVRPIPSPIPSVLEYFDPTYLGREEVRQAFLQGKSEMWGTSNIDSCTYSFHTGRCFHCNWEENQPKHNEWEGRDRFERQGDWGYVGVLGLLLDLDAGTLTVYKDGRRLGVMCEDLAGEYCWVVSIYGAGGISIERGAIPDDA